jgi:hypothetical protein
LPFTQATKDSLAECLICIAQCFVCDLECIEDILGEPVDCLACLGNQTECNPCVEKCDELNVDPTILY